MVNGGNGRSPCHPVTLSGNGRLILSLCYTLAMDASEAKAYVQRWEAIAEIEQQEQQSRPIAENWRQLNAIKRRAVRLGITREDDEGEMALFMLWARLKAQYVDN